MEPASPLLSAGFIMVCFLGAVRLSTGDESHCPCPKIPPWPLTEDPPEKCHQISDTFRYTCLVGYVRKAGTSNLIKCELKNKVGQWQNSTLQCIDDPKRPKLPTTPQSTTPKNLSDNPQDTTMTSTAKSSTSVYMKQSTVSQEGKTGDKVDDKAHDAVTPTPGKIRKAETTTTRNGTSNPYADPTAAHSAGTQAAAIVSPILLVLICAAIGIGFILHWRKSRHNLPQQPGEELVPMNPACGLPS
uniref:Sushi domain-containing protein n=1 Tax=Salarias fasciatus TaxID=181472 RepID=A0A672GXB6_SALFA